MLAGKTLEGERREELEVPRTIMEVRGEGERVPEARRIDTRKEMMGHAVECGPTPWCPQDLQQNPLNSNSWREH